MKKLLVFLLCAALMIPTVGMNAQAAGTDSVQTVNNQGESTGKEDVETPAPEKTFKELANEAIVDLNDYYVILQVNDQQKEAADAAMKTAAIQLGYIYEPADKAPKVGKFIEGNEPLLKDKDGIELCVTTTKQKLDKAVAPIPEPEPDQEPQPDPSNSNVIIGGKEYDTTIANAGHHCEIAVPLVNLGETKVTNVVITPALSGDVTAWPFAIEKTDYSQVCDKLEGENSGKSILERKNTFRWTLKTRDDAVTGYTKLVFNVSYNEEDGTQKTVALDYYVQVNGVAPKAEGGKISTPRVIVTGFTTTPEEVYAGDTFKLTLNLKNTSKKTAVSNMLFDIQGTQEGKDADSTYSAFLPTAGSSTIYVDSIAPNASKSITIEMKSKSDLAQKPYVVTVNMEYEDSDANPFTETASVSVPIKQEPKVDVSSITVMPETMEVGNEANVMFSIYNVGKTKLYNVNVKFEADSISGGDTFIGNMDPGATGNVDAYLMGQAATLDDGTVKVLITYENEEGKEEKIEKTCTLFVSEPYYPEDMEGMGMPEEIEPEKTGLPWWGIVLIVVAAVIAAAAAVLVIKKKKRAKLQAQEELEVIDLLEDSQNEEK